MNPTVARAVVLGILSALTATGLLPPDVHEALHDQVDPILAGVFALWSVFAVLRHRKDKKAGIA